MADSLTEARTIYHPLHGARYSRTAGDIIQKYVPESGGIVFTLLAKGRRLYRVTPVENLRLSLDALDREADYFSFESWPEATERDQRCAFVRANFRPIVRD